MRKARKETQDIPLWMKELHFKDGKLSATLEGKKATQAMVGMFGEMFEECGGVNFVSLRLIHSKHGPMEMVLRRELGKTPYDVAAERLRRIGDLEDALGEALTALVEWNVELDLRARIRKVLKEQGS